MVTDRTRTELGQQRRIARSEKDFGKRTGGMVVPRVQFSLRTFMFAVICLACTIVGVSWWTRPFIVTTESYPNGSRASIMWRRRTLLFKTTHERTVRFYPNGELAFEFANGKKTYWAPDGKEISSGEWRNKYAGIVLSREIEPDR